MGCNCASSRWASVLALSLGIAAGAASLTGVFVGSRAEATTTMASPEVGDAAPDFKHLDAEGKEHALSGYAGKVVVLDFWATWCGPCKRAMPGLQKLHEEFKDKGLVVIGMNTSERGNPTDYMSKQKFTYLNLLKTDETAEAYGVRGIPHMFVIGHDGKVVASIVGFSKENEETLRKSVEKALKAVPASFGASR